MSLIRRLNGRKLFMVGMVAALLLVFVLIPGASAAAQTFPTPAPDTAVTVADVKGTTQQLGLWALAILGIVITIALLLWKRTRRG